MERPIHTARLLTKLLLSDPAQCFHLEFAVEDMERFDFAPGQFVSMVTPDAAGKMQTRAYSLASAPRGNQFDLCVNRVEDGFFSNLLCDLVPGDSIRFHGPHGMFLLREPLTDAVMIATGTGIAPMRGFIEYLFPDNAPDRTEGRQISLVYGTRHATELYYGDYFARVAAEHPSFRYITTLSRPDESWAGPRGYVQEHVQGIVCAHPSYVPNAATPPAAAPVAEAPATFSIHAYICGLNNMVSANRECLKALGWQRKQIIFERYD
jgi:ferredoxin-NADP reductase